VCELQRALIEVCASYGIVATTDPGNVGVWVGASKIGAIGVHVSRGVTTHGFALNVSPDLSAFNGIIPCGIVDRGVTSLAALGVSPPPSVREVADRAARALASRLGREAALVEPSVVREAEHVGGAAFQFQRGHQVPGVEAVQVQGSVGVRV
jgi:lipoyl(octanoyl) transferase